VVRLCSRRLNKWVPLGNGRDAFDYDLMGGSFSEAVDSNFSRVRLLNDRREEVDRGDSRVAANDPRSMLVSVPQGLPNGV